MITEEQLRENPRMAAIVAEALSKQYPHKTTRLQDIMEAPVKKVSTAPPVPTEDDECFTFVKFLDLMQSSGKIDLYTHIPNETYTDSFKQRQRNKDMGVRKGFPDYIIIAGNKLIVIEMKRIKGSVVSDEQKAWIEALKRVGVIVEVCYGYDHAKRFLESYL